METEGWYTRIFIDQNSEVRWVTVSNHWIDIFKNKKDKIPAMSFHVSKLEVEENIKRSGCPHAILVNIKHTAIIQNLIISTPNQFDIIDISKAIKEEISKWNAYYTSTKPALPKSYSMDLTGKFVYRDIDRVKVNVNENELIITAGEKTESKVAIADESFDAYPTLETSEDPKWISISSSKGSYHLHCSNIDDFKSFIETVLHLSSICHK